MALAEFLQQLDDLGSAAEQTFGSADDAESVEAARVEYLGAKQGRLKAVQKQMGGVDSGDRRAAGMRFNEVKQRVESAFQAATERLASGGSRVQRGPHFDPTLPGTPVRSGRLHPITQTIEELKDIMGRLGFSAAEGPEIEDEWHNFEALNIPREHPARDPLDNFYLSAAERTGGGRRCCCGARPAPCRSG
jgi:phenylalanyl-tRNA synthetase alpha chain